MVQVLTEVTPPAQTFAAYEPLISKQLYRDIREMAEELRGAKIVMLNSTAYGGGVAELLEGVVPLLQSLGLDCRWLVMPDHPEFFHVTKGLHNALQGGHFDLTAAAQTLYETQSQLVGTLLATEPADVWEIHDPQAAGVIAQLPTRRSIWRCHIDTSTPDPQVWRYVQKSIEQYQEAIFTLPEYVPHGWHGGKLNFITPTIDAFSAKNRPMPTAEARRITAGLGLDSSQPLILQVSRFDPIKDPRGVIDAFRLMKQATGPAQLALVGSLATDDPAATEVLAELREYTQGDDDIFLLSNLTGAQVNALHTTATIVVQKSLREGFGLTVTEGMWKSKPVIGGNVGGIKVQITDGANGYLVDSVEACASKLIELVTNPTKRVVMGRRGRATVLGHFLHPQLLHDHLMIYRRLIA
jgi:trehalose synthase